jgi:hypothetical protein
MKWIFLLLSSIFCRTGFGNTINITYPAIDTPLIVRYCTDFTITGKGENPEWQKTKWTNLTRIDQAGKEHETKFKILYSANGVYVLFSGQDETITSTFNNDFEDLYKGDVFEVFFYPEPARPVYFEYEISPLNKELVLLISKQNGKYTRWMPWHYNEQNKVVKNVAIQGGAMKSGSNIQGWSAELFFPYQILVPVMNTRPVSGVRWNANFCRLDYDSGKMTKWSWSPIKVSFHEVEKYFSLQFE